MGIAQTPSPTDASSDSVSDDDDDESDEAADEARALFSDQDNAQYALNDDGQQIEHVTIGLSSVTVRNFWLMVGSFCIFNLVLYLICRRGSLCPQTSRDGVATNGNHSEF